MSGARARAAVIAVLAMPAAIDAQVAVQQVQAPEQFQAPQQTRRAGPIVWTLRIAAFLLGTGAMLSILYYAFGQLFETDARLFENVPTTVVTAILVALSLTAWSASHWFHGRSATVARIGAAER